MAHEELICEAGHTFTRETSRGRKPKWCPEHDPRLNEQPVVAQRETYVCKQCGNSWSRKPQRGRKPTLCPDCAPSPRVRAQNSEMETLHCEIGDHDWDRPRQRGKRPTNCPEHRQAAVASAKPRIQSLAELSAQYKMDDESIRIISYVESEINSPAWPRSRDSEDIKALLAGYDARVRYVKQRNRHVPQPVVEVI